MKTAAEGLPEHLFNYISSVTPLINIDILLLTQRSEVALTWRDDGTYGPGWHVPGGIVRFKESIQSRINQVCLRELGVSQISSTTLLQVNQIMNPARDYRGHFISLLFSARTSEDILETSTANDLLPNGYLSLFNSSPPNLIPQHKRYHEIIDLLCGSSSGMHKQLSNLSLVGNLLENYSPNDESALLTNDA